tara:strand:- start:668 stop:847 length:180 start_codon:yes stop_codon:yes gene_type:complete
MQIFPKKTFTISRREAGVNSYYTAKSECGKIVYTRKSLSSLAAFIKGKGYNINPIQYRQ